MADGVLGCLFLDVLFLGFSTFGSNETMVCNCRYLVYDIALGLVVWDGMDWV
jgi:hypothetical protein